MGVSLSLLLASCDILGESFSHMLSIGVFRNKLSHILFFPPHRIKWTSGKKELSDSSCPLEVGGASLLGNYHIVKGVGTMKLLRGLHLGNEEVNFLSQWQQMKFVEKFHFKYSSPYVPFFFFNLGEQILCHAIQGPFKALPDLALLYSSSCVWHHWLHAYLEV